MSVNKVQLSNGETIIDISDSTVTPETLAEGVTAHDASGQKITGKMVPGGGSKTVQTDWDQKNETEPDFLKNKPFGESYGDTLYFDGNTEGLECIDVAGDGSFLLVRLCDTVVTKEDVANGYSFMAHMNETVTGTFDGETAQSAFQDNGFGSLADVALVFPYDGFDLDGITIAKAGVYTVVSNGRVVPFSITIPGYTGFPVTKKMEEKYLPGAVILYVDEENYLYAAADTSDTSKRMTKTELLEAVDSGRAVWFGLEMDGVIQRMFVESVVILPTHGLITFAGGEAFTAEYVPEG